MIVRSVGMVDPAQYMRGTLNSGQKARWTRSFSNICSYDGRVSDKRREHHDVYEPTSGHRRDLTTWSPRPSAWFPKLTARWGGAVEPKWLGRSKKLNKMRPIQETSEKREKGGANSKEQKLCLLGYPSVNQINELSGFAE